PASQRTVKYLIAISIVLAVTTGGVVAGQARGAGEGRGAAPRPPSAPAPRWPDGRINLGAPPGEKGVWERRNEHLVQNPLSYQAAATKTARVHIDNVPLQPWARALTNA